MEAHMPVYYFSLSDRIELDPESDPAVEDLPNDDAAKLYARQIAAELGRHADVWPRVRVFDATGQGVT
jgi:hypothetical protein